MQVSLPVHVIVLESGADFDPLQSCACAGEEVEVVILSRPASESAPRFQDRTRTRLNQLVREGRDIVSAELVLTDEPENATARTELARLLLRQFAEDQGQSSLTIRGIGGTERGRCELWQLVEMLTSERHPWVTVRAMLQEPKRRESRAA